jgi:hypothetical protein
MTTHIQASAFEPLNTDNSPSPDGARPVRWVALAIASVFVLIMAFLLTAKSLQINVQAIGDSSIELSGGLILPFGDRYLLRPGEFQAQASAPGYHTLHSSITVSDKDSQVVELILQPLPGRLSIASQPPGAKVFIDSELAGETPLQEFPVEAGEHTLEIQAPRYLPLQQGLDVTGREIQQQLDLVLQPAWADVTLDSTPRGANILVAGEVVGTTPAVLEILQGEQQIALRKEGFAGWQAMLEIVP